MTRTSATRISRYVKLTAFAALLGACGGVQDDALTNGSGKGEYTLPGEVKAVFDRFYKQHGDLATLQQQIRKQSYGPLDDYVGGFLVSDAPLKQTMGVAQLLHGYITPGVKGFRLAFFGKQRFDLSTVEKVDIFLAAPQDGEISYSQAAKDVVVDRSDPQVWKVAWGCGDPAEPPFYSATNPIKIRAGNLALENLKRFSDLADKSYDDALAHHGDWAAVIVLKKTGEDSVYLPAIVGSTQQISNSGPSCSR
ncbi:MAG: hypothetical protein H6707_00875 [Deltaproteobacteria bacterium]|nr:hypothetical protein [Deltaproteobacteria bacterium]